MEYFEVFVLDVPEWALRLGRYATPTDGCECVYTFIRGVGRIVWRLFA